METVTENNLTSTTRVNVCLASEESSTCATPTTTNPSWTFHNQFPHRYVATSRPPTDGFQRSRDLNEDWRCTQNGDGLMMKRRGSSNFHPPPHPRFPQSHPRPATSMPLMRFASLPSFDNSSPQQQQRANTFIPSSVSAPLPGCETPFQSFHCQRKSNSRSERGVLNASPELMHCDLQNYGVQSIQGMPSSDFSTCRSSSQSSYQNPFYHQGPPGSCGPCNPHHREWSGGRRAAREFLPALQSTIQKTRLCLQLTRGLPCLKRACSFAHSMSELRPRPDLYRTKLCRSFSEGKLCQSGTACSFAHGLAELRHVRAHASDNYRLTTVAVQIHVIT